MNLFTKLFKKDIAGETKTQLTQAQKMFAGIYGYDPLKEIVYELVESKNSNHFLFNAPPGTAKSLFLHTIENAKGKKAKYVLGGSFSKAGGYDYLFEHGKELDYLIVDEMEKMKPEDQAAFLELMENGILTQMKSGKTRGPIKLKLTVIAATNNTKKMLEPLLTRFQPNIFTLKQYTEDEYVDIAMQLVRDELGIKEDMGEIIARKMYGMKQNVRACVKAGKFAGNDLVKLDKYIDTIRMYSE